MPQYRQNTFTSPQARRSLLGDWEPALGAAVFGLALDGWKGPKEKNMASIE